MPRSITQMRCALPYCAFDLLQEGAQRRLVGGVARQDLVGQRKALRRHDQRDDHLHAVAALVAAVAVAALVLLIGRRIAFEVGARQIVEQHIELGAEQILPALAQMAEQSLLVRQQLVQAAIECILRDQRVILAEQIGHRALLEPLPVQPPLAARIDQPIAHQRLQDVLPAGPFARVRQARPPRTDPARAAHRDGTPASTRPIAAADAAPSRRAAPARHSPWRGPAPLARPETTPVASVRWRPFVERFDHPAPGLALAVVDLAQVQHRPLHHLAAGAALALDNAPVAMLLAVLETS